HVDAKIALKIGIGKAVERVEEDGSRAIDQPVHLLWHGCHRHRRFAYRIPAVPLDGGLAGFVATEAVHLRTSNQQLLGHGRTYPAAGTNHQDVFPVEIHYLPLNSRYFRNSLRVASSKNLPL